MKNQIVSIDLETTGLDPGSGHMIEFAAVVDDLESPIADLPCFRRLMHTNDGMIGGDPFALNMNAGIIAEIVAIQKANKLLPAEDQNILLIPIGKLLGQFGDWAKEIGLEMPMTVAGKNVANFDMKFLDGIGFQKYYKCRHRMVDPGSMYYDYKLDGSTLPDTKTCLQRAGLPCDVKHRAEEDARDVLRLIRFKQGIPF